MCGRVGGWGVLYWVRCDKVGGARALCGDSTVRRVNGNWVVTELRLKYIIVIRLNSVN